jgi:hypothetical protein
MDTSYIKKLKMELMYQWISNHGEHCGFEFHPCSNPCGCQWPIPKIIPPNEVCLLLSQVVGEKIEPLK